MIKTAGEIAAMRRNYELITVAQNAAKEAVQPGKLELDVWHAIHTALQQAAQQTMPLGNDCTVGRRGGGPPHPIEILETDSFVVDLSTILEGYWSDSCVTYYATAPSPKQIKMHRTAAEALDLAISLARPGAVAREIDGQVRGFITNAGFPVYPHHTGHGIGVMGHEAPRIVPHSDEVLQAGMVIMLEPGIYYPGETGVRLEHAVLVTEDGPEVLSTYDLNVP
jgi:Xaa-Pro aminopeptidase